MENNQGFTYAYGWNVYYQQIMGGCERKNEGWFVAQRAWAWALLMILLIWIPQTASLSILSGDLNLMINCLATNMSIAISIVKIMVLQYQRKVTGWILVTIVDDWARVGSKDELETMLETARISRSISILSFTLTNIMFFEYAFSRIWILMENVDRDVDPRLAFGLLHDAYFPFDTTNLRIFVPLWICQFFGTFLNMVSYGGPDCFISMIVLHLCGQLRIIRNSLKYLVDDTTVRNREKYWRTVTAIVKRHEQLNELSRVIRETFSAILLVEILVCSVTFCFQGYALFTTMMDRNGAPIPIFDLGFSVIYGGYTVIHLFIHCYVGDKLLVEVSGDGTHFIPKLITITILQSTSLSDDFYETEWYNLAPEEAKVFLFVCHRSYIPLEVKAGKFCTFNLQLFNSIMKSSMGYLSMLMAMKERLVD